MFSKSLFFIDLICITIYIIFYYVCLDGVGLYNCFTCWVDFHHRKKELWFHKYSIVLCTKKKYDPSSWQSCFCDEPANRKCYGIVKPKSTDELISQQKRTVHRHRKSSKKHEVPQIVTLEQFDEKVWIDWKIPISDEMVERIYHNSFQMIRPSSPSLLSKTNHPCTTPTIMTTNVRLWKKLEDHLHHKNRHSCNDLYCTHCWEQTHQYGFRVQHTWVGLEFNNNIDRTPMFCLECSDNTNNNPATPRCQTCNDAFYS